MNLPNKITIFRMGMVVLLVFLMLFPWSSCGVDFFDIKIFEIEGKVLTLQYLIGFILFLIASISDYFDGHIARKYNLVTNFGKFMDPIADKLLVNSSFIILALQGPVRIPAIVVVVMIGRDIIVDALRLLAMENGTVIAASFWGKAKTVAQMAALCFVYLADFPFCYFDGNFSISILICYIAMVISIISGVMYVWSGRALLKGDKASHE